MGVLRLIRPINGVIASLVVLVSAKITDNMDLRVFYLIIGAFFISSFLNATNDMFDINEDRINHPERPLITGETTTLDAVMVSIICLFMGIYMSAKHSPWALMVGSLGMFAGIMYNCEVKSIPVMGNFAVVFVIFLAFLYGSNPGEIFRIFPAAFLGAYLHLIREFVKSLEDREGDKVNRRTIAHIFGERFLQHLIFASIIIFTILDVFPVMLGYSMFYGIGVFLFVNGPLLAFAWVIYISKYNLMSRVLKIITILAIIPLWMA